MDSFLNGLHAFATLVSLAATAPAICVCLLVLIAWRSEYVRYCKTWNKSPSQTLIAGVFIGFCGSMVDNAWWGMAWTADYLEHPWKEFLFANGVYPNIFFRQFALIWAGSLHIAAENMARQTSSAVKVAKIKSRNTLYFSGASGIVFVIILYIIKHL